MVLTEEERREVWKGGATRRGDRGEGVPPREVRGVGGEERGVDGGEAVEGDERGGERGSAELWGTGERANQLARYLERGVRAETRVGLCVGRSLELGVGTLGILRAAERYVTAGCEPAGGEVEEGFRELGVEVLVIRREERERLSDLLSGFSVVEVEETRGESGERVESGVGGEDAAYVM